MTHSAPVLCSSITLPEGAVPDWLHLLPAGEVRTKDGRGPYRVRDAQAFMSASIALGKLPLDENHATDLAAPKGGAAPARGWIVELQQRADGIWGRVEWTSTGRQIMQDREYSGVSPVIVHNAAGDVSAILRASLTNTPNIAGLRTLHSASPQTPPDAAAPALHPQEIMRQAHEMQAMCERYGMPIDFQTAISSIMEEATNAAIDAAAQPSDAAAVAASARGLQAVFQKLGLEIDYGAAVEKVTTAGMVG